MHEMRHRCATELQLRFLNRATATGAHREPNRVRGLSFVDERALLPIGRSMDDGVLDISLRFQVHATTAVLACD